MVNNNDEDNNQGINETDDNNINAGNNNQDNESINNVNNKNQNAKKSDIALYVEIAFIIVGIILLAIGSLQLKSIGHAKWNDFTDIFFPLGIIFIVSPGLLHFRKLRTKKFAMYILIVLLIGILIMYILLVPYKMFIIHFGLLGDVIAEYIIGLFFIIFFVSHLTKKRLLKKE